MSRPPSSKAPAKTPPVSDVEPAIPPSNAAIDAALAAAQAAIEQANEATEAAMAAAERAIADSLSSPPALEAPAADGATEVGAEPLLKQAQLSSQPQSSATSTVNSQVLDAVAEAARAPEAAPALAAALLKVAGAQSLGLAMHNAVARQQADCVVGQAAIAAACARILDQGGVALVTPKPAPQPEGTSA